MEFLKSNSHILIGGVPEDRQPEYIFSLCCEVDSRDKKHKFLDIALSRKQCEQLRDSLTQYLDPDLTPIKLDTDLFSELRKLMESAENKADQMLNQPLIPSEDEYARYRDECFVAINTRFWDIASQLPHPDLEYWDNPGGSVEDQMKSWLQHRWNIGN